MTRTLALAAALSLVLSGAASAANTCRDGKGKFVKCPPAKTAPVRCKDAKGKFAKCGAPGVKPA